jgi:RNA polymerase sigma-70 factor (ECF subfamily)
LDEARQFPVSPTKNRLSPRAPNSFKDRIGRPESLGILTKLYGQYKEELTKYIQSKFGSGPPEPEDVVQSSFSKLAGVSRLEEIKNPRAYLYTIARHYIIDYHKQSNRTESYKKSVQQDLDHAESMSPSTAEQVLMGKERLATLIKALNKLPKKQRRLVILNRFHGLTCKEIGERENMQAKAVQRQIHRALTRCLDELDAADETQ